MKRVPLRRGGPLHRRTKLRAISRKRLADQARRAQVRTEVFLRDGFECQWPELERVCFGPLTPHHLKKASSGGRYVADNLVTLCEYHNGMVEDWPLLAQRLGLVRR